ncbi:MAG: rhodanese-like domain-containing protein [Pseudomonadales bacterium]
MRTITRQETEQKLESDEQVVLIEALPEENFRKFHLPGAVNLPTDDPEFEQKAAKLIPEKSTPVILYCQNTECDASPRAAKRLETLGYQSVFDYEAGKEDWREAGNRLETY